MGERLDTLAAAAGVELRRHAPLGVDGVAVEATLLPADGETLAAALRALGEAGLAVLPCGGGSRLGLGNPPRRADALLSTERLRGVDTLDAAEGVCHVRAGTPLAALRAEVEAAGWELPLEGAGSLGGALATALASPRSQGLGRARDAVLGLEVALADGSRARCGGRVVKNVTGYDLAKLYLGSAGRLAVILGAWLRLRPRPEALRRLAGAPLDDAAACRWSLEWSRRGALRSIVLVPAPGGLAPWVELAGDAASVEAGAERMRGEGLREVEEAEHARALDAASGAARDCRFRVSHRASRLEACLAALREAGAEPTLLPGLDLVLAGFDPARPADVTFDAASRAAAAGGGRALCEAAPPSHKAGRDVYAATAAEVALTRRLLERFDPAGVLSPGRGPGGL